MSARGGRNNASYAWVPLRLSRECSRCGASRGRRCGRMVGEQWIEMQGTHTERRKKRT